MARRTGARVVSVDYRLAPEQPYPAALQDARSASQALLDSAMLEEGDAALSRVAAFLGAHADLRVAGGAGSQG